MQQVLSGITVLLFLIAAPPYIIDTIRGKTRPERATWLIWTILSVIALVSQIKLGATWSLIITAVDVFGSAIVFVLALWFGVGGWTKLDRLVLAIATLGVLGSVIAKQPLVALLSVMIADASGAVLTIRKTYQDPDSETTASWLLMGTSGLFSALSVGQLNLQLLLYPVYLSLGSYSVPVTQAIGRIARQHRHHRVK